MTWIEAATVVCAVYAALLSTLVAIRQQQRIRRGDPVYLDDPLPGCDRVKVAGDGGAVSLTGGAGAGSQAGNPVYWDGRLPIRVTKTPSYGPLLDPTGYSVVQSDSQPVDPGVVK